MDKYINRGKYFNRSLSGTETAMGYLIALPAFLFCSVYISSAIVKFIFLSMGRTVDYYLVSTLINVLDDALVLVLCLYIFKDFMKRQLKDLKKNFFKILFSGAIIGYIFCIVGNVVGNIILRFFTSTTTSVNQSAVTTLTNQYPAIMIVMTVLVGPLTEELLFRGLVFTSIRKHSRLLAYLVSAFLFGFIHVMDSVLGGNFSEMIQMIPYAVMGLVFCYMYESTNNIFGSVFAHMAQNSVAMISLLVAAGIV